MRLTIFTSFFVFNTLIFFFLPGCNCTDPITWTGVVTSLVGAAVYSGWQYGKCKLNECCDDDWISPNFYTLESDLNRKFHGQHLAKKIILRSIKSHLRNKNPKKALVLAFHGWTGSGKNFASNIIAENLYKKGLHSQYFHQYIATQHFPHRSRLEEYQIKLQNEIGKHTRLCGRSLFVFDEMDKMPIGLVDILKPYIDYYGDIDGIDYRKNIFIFLSNAGGSAITNVTFKFWLEGKDRESITLKDIESVVNRGAFNENGGLKGSDIIRKNLIDFFVPFLPLERRHVKMCIRDELLLRKKSTSDNLINKIADHFDYYPENEDIPVYSISGCKKVSQKVDFFVDD